MRTVNRHFLRHYAEMVLAMLLGMLVLGVPAYLALDAMGVSKAELEGDAPALALLLMATTMTVPMVGWMRFRGHGWTPCAEMAGAMYVPTFAAIALLAASVVTDIDVLLAVQHVVMFPAMFAVMLLRPDEYAHAPGAHERVAA